MLGLLEGRVCAETGRLLLTLVAQVSCPTGQGEPVKGGTMASSVGKLVQQSTWMTPAQMASIVR